MWDTINKNIPSFKENILEVLELSSALRTPHGGIGLQQIKVNRASGSISSPASIPTEIDFGNFKGFSFQIIKFEKIEDLNSITGSPL